jgi:hypothetical protein
MSRAVHCIGYTPICVFCDIQFFGDTPIYVSRSVHCIRQNPICVSRAVHCISYKQMCVTCYSLYCFPQIWIPCCSFFRLYYHTCVMRCSLYRLNSANVFPVPLNVSVILPYMCHVLSTVSVIPPYVCPVLLTVSVILLYMSPVLFTESVILPYVSCAVHCVGYTPIYVS